jgi:thiaminase
MFQKFLKKNTVSLEDFREALHILILLCERLEKNISELKSLETTVNKKIDRLEQMLQKAELMEEMVEKRDRDNEVRALSDKGISSDEISRILNIPKGEVELILKVQNGKKIQ